MTIIMTVKLKLKRVKLSMMYWIYWSGMVPIHDHYMPLNRLWRLFTILLNLPLLKLQFRNGKVVVMEERMARKRKMVIMVAPLMWMQLACQCMILFRLIYTGLFDPCWIMPRHPRRPHCNVGQLPRYVISLQRIEDVRACTLINTNLSWHS